MTAAPFSPTLERELSELTWPDVEALAARGAWPVVPVGSTEQHGPHLPLSVDTDVALLLCRRLASRRRDVLVAPAVPYGSSGEHAAFPGTLSIGREATTVVLVELGRSATDAFGRVLFVSAHGGNLEPARRAMRVLAGEGRRTRLHTPLWHNSQNEQIEHNSQNEQSDLHAGHAETSMMLATAPWRVRRDAVVAGDTRPLAEIWPQLHAGGVRAVSSSGVLGDPTRADAAAGEELLDVLTRALEADVEAWLAEDKR
jgi:mycofactocin precursor peptide peptidase